MAPKPVDYSLYLVTDSTPAILGDKDLVAVVKAAVEGGRSRLKLPCDWLMLTTRRGHDRTVS